MGSFRPPGGVRKPSPCVEALEPDQLDDLTSKLAADPDLQMHLRGAFQNFEGIKAPTKLHIESRVEAAAPMDEKYNAEVVRWYDHWLKGVDNGIMDEPPIRIHVRGSGFREEREALAGMVPWYPSVLPGAHADDEADAAKHAIEPPIHIRKEPRFQFMPRLPP